MPVIPGRNDGDDQAARQPVKPLGGRKKRNAKQRAKQTYAKARENAQLLDVIPTVPEGAVRDERVDPASQSEQQFPTLVQAAISGGWSVPEAIKRQVINSLAKPFFEKSTTVMTKEGVAIEVPVDPYLLKENAKVLLSADKHQWEKDNPEEAGKAAGGTTVNFEMREDERADAVAAIIARFGGAIPGQADQQQAGATGPTVGKAGTGDGTSLHGGRRLAALVVEDQASADDGVLLPSIGEEPDGGGDGAGEGAA